MIFIHFVLSLAATFIPHGKAQLQIGGFGVGGVGDILQCAQQFQAASEYPNSDIGLKTPEYLAKYGYPSLNYTVNTKDGYTLNVFRIPYSPKSPLVPGTKKKAVYMNHGLGGNGQQWMIQCRNNLALLLADNGFDVFLGNGRGVSYSPAPANANRSFWDFSWHEMAMNDVPATIDMILNVTETQKLYYIGHSMGTTQYFIAMSAPELQAYNAKIYTGILLAPIAYMGHATNVVRLLAPLGYNAQYLTAPVVGGKLDASQQLEDMTGLSLGALCSPSALACTACSNAMFLIFGYDGSQMNYTNLSYLLSLFPDNVPTKSLVHYAQSMDTGKFRQFDYGSPLANEAHYGKGIFSPAEYDLGQITAPTVFINSLNDNFGVPVDVNITASKMNPSALKLVYTIPVPEFNHMDFIIAKDGRSLLYDRIVTMMVNGVYE